MHLLKQGTFISKQFNRLLLGSLWGALGYAINLMTDSLVSGNQLGETALSAVSIVYPLYSIIAVFACLLPMGISVMFGKAIGEFKQEEAYRVAGTGVLAAAIISILLALGLWIMRDPFLTYYGCTGELLKEAATYYNWTIIVSLINPVGSVIYYLVITDGESVLYSVGNIAGILANIILSFIFSGLFGIAGLAVATILGNLCIFVCYVAHFFKKSNNVRFRFCLDLKIVRRAIVLSLSDYMYYLFLAIVDIVLNKIIIANCGIDYIPAYSVINLVFSVCEIYIAVNNASIGFLTCFLGEKNNYGLKMVFRKITRAVVVLALCLTAFFFFGAPLMPIIYGLSTPVTVNAAIMASRVMAFTTLGFGANYVIGSVSGSLEKPVQACFIGFLNDVCSPLVLSLVFGSLWGFTGITVGMFLSSYFAYGLYALVLIWRKGKAGFPIYEKDYETRVVSYDLYVEPEAIVELRDAVSHDLHQAGYEIQNIELLMEEFFNRVLEKNPGKKVLAECTLLFEADKVRIIMRDNGMLFNFVDENNKVESLNAHVLNCLLEHVEKKNYVLTTSFNRNGFVFAKK